eukprot:789494-Prymnesium_polylepis.1
MAERDARERALRGVACVGGWEGVAAAPNTTCCSPAHLRSCLPPVSLNLANPCHVDVNDAARSYAVWVRLMPHLGS